MTFKELLDFYTDHLTHQVMPFWLKLVDWEHGGLNNCVGSDGVIQSTDKYLWSQGRALWTFSALYNDFDHDPKWLDVAHNLAKFVMTHGRLGDGSWAFCLHQDGSVAANHQSISADAFAIYGLTEYARATGNPQALDIAVRSFERTSPLLDDHSSFPSRPHQIQPGMQGHGPPMIFSLVYHDLGQLTGERRIIDRALEQAEIVMTQHVKPEHKLLYERVQPGGDLDDSDVGKTFVPGHAIESMWFMERIYQTHRRQDRIDLAIQVIRWHLEKGWDSEFGGLYLACHTEGGPPQWVAPDAKIWWPHTEALFALLKAYQVTGEDWCLNWYWRVHDYTFSHFPNQEHGDWHHNLDRQGRPQPPIIKSLPVKDPFHLPRALLYSILVLRELA